MKQYFLIPVLLLSACAPQPPSSPMEQKARLAAAADFAAQNCAGYAGGYTGAQQMKRDANENLVAARQLGATDEVIKKAKTDVQTVFNTTVAFSNKQEACNQLISRVAWANN